MGPDPSLCSSTIETPNTATSSDTATDVPNSKMTVPWPEGTYIIRDPNSGLIVTLVDGAIRLEPRLGDQGGYHCNLERRENAVPHSSFKLTIHI